MAFDATKDFGTCLGGKTHGFVMQDGKLYNHDRVEVDAVTGAPKTTYVPPVKKAAAKPAVDPQVAEQLKG